MHEEKMPQGNIYYFIFLGLMYILFILTMVFLAKTFTFDPFLSNYWYNPNDSAQNNYCAVQKHQKQPMCSDLKINIPEFQKIQKFSKDFNKNWRYESDTYVKNKYIPSSHIYQQEILFNWNDQRDKKIQGYSFGDCDDYAITYINTILDSNLISNKDILYVVGSTQYPGEKEFGHAWVEIRIKGVIYLADNNNLGLFRKLDYKNIYKLANNEYYLLSDLEIKGKK